MKKSTFQIGVLGVGPWLGFIILSLFGLDPGPSSPKIMTGLSIWLLIMAFVGNNTHQKEIKLEKDAVREKEMENYRIRRLEEEVNQLKAEKENRQYPK